MPAPLRPRSDKVQHGIETDLIDWLFKAYRAHREGGAKQPPWPDQGRGAPDPFLNSRPWRVIEPPPGVQQPMPFYADQLETLLKIPLKDLKSPTRGGPLEEKAVQPPIFFPLD